MDKIKSILNTIFLRLHLLPFITALRTLFVIEIKKGHFRSVNIWGSIDENNEPVPWITYPTIDYLKSLNLSNMKVFEYGSGNSTAFWSRNAKEVFKSNLVGLLSVFTVGFSNDLLHYAVNGASESAFIFEIVAASYFASFKKKSANFVCILLLVLMYFTRPQAFIYIAGIILYWLLLNFDSKKALIGFLGVVIAGILLDYLILRPLSGNLFIYSVFFRWSTSTFTQTATASDALRGISSGSPNFVQTFKNIFYNLYNFYKLLPQIFNPYLFGFFVVGLF